MATILQANQGAQQDDENKDKAVQASSAQTTQIGAGQGQPSAGQVKAQGPSSSGRFANIQSFLKANQSGQIGQQVGQQVGAEKQKATQKLQESKDAFGGQIGQVRAGVEASNKAVNEGIANLANGGEYNPSETAFNAGVQALSSAKNLAYTGPEQLANTEQLYGQSQNLQQIGQASKTEGGRAALLQRFFGRDRPTYSTGQNKLDNLLLGRQSGALADVRRSASNFTKDLSQSEQAALSSAAGLKGNITDLNKLASDEAVKAQSALESDVIADTTANANSQYAKAVSDFNNSGIRETLGNDITFDQAVNAGYVAVPEALKRLVQGQGTVTDISALDKNRAARLKALGGLTGVDKGYTSEVADIGGTSVDMAAGSKLKAEVINNKKALASVPLTQVAENDNVVKAFLDNINSLNKRAGEKRFAKDSKVADAGGMRNLIMDGSIVNTKAIQENIKKFPQLAKLYQGLRDYMQRKDSATALNTARENFGATALAPGSKPSGGYSTF